MTSEYTDKTQLLTIQIEYNKTKYIHRRNWKIKKKFYELDNHPNNLASCIS